MPASCEDFAPSVRRPGAFAATPWTPGSPLSVPQRNRTLGGIPTPSYIVMRNETDPHKPWLVLKRP